MFILFVVMVVWVGYIVFSLFKIQIFEYTKYLTKIKAQKTRVFSLHPKRGTIYDRNGEILAISVRAKSAFISNKDKLESLTLFRKIAAKIKLPRRKQRDIRKRIERGEKFIWIKRKLTQPEYNHLQKLSLSPDLHSSLDFIEEYKRIYPQKNIAAHVLGGVGIDEQGLYGVEYSLDSLIRGQGGRAKVELDARRKVFKINYLETPVPGRDLYLSIDASISFFVEQELTTTIKKSRAKGGTIIVLDARNGSVLAMASYPFYQPDRISTTSPMVLKNKAISFIYEPGSTFKVILASTALEKRVCYPQQIFDCYDGTFEIGDRTIVDIRGYGKMSFEDIIVHSSNIGAAKIGLRLGKDRYHKFIKEFGFGQKLGISLPAEEKGIFHPLKNWNQVTVAFHSDGYGIAVTPLQMATAFNVIASGGYFIPPTIIKQPAGRGAGSRKVKRILSSSTVHKLTTILTEVVSRGTGKKARINGIDIAGKTGTAKKLKNGKFQKIYVSSFGGFFPANRPRITILVVIDEPVGLYYGGDVAAPLFRRIAEKIMVYLKIFPELDTTNEVHI